MLFTRSVVLREDSEIDLLLRIDVSLEHHVVKPAKGF
jgi:hypothetical protein